MYEYFVAFLALLFIPVVIVYVEHQYMWFARGVRVDCGVRDRSEE